MRKAQLICKVLDEFPIEYHYMTHDEMLECSKKGLEDYLKHLRERYNRDFNDRIRD